MLALTILGCNSALPAYGRNPTAQVLQTQNESFLIDCGEGTQSQLIRYKVKRSRIRHIFISHLHGDHYFGLIGLITSMGLLNHNKPLHVHGPAPLEAILRLQLDAAGTELPYSLHFHPITGPGEIANTGTMRVTCFPVKHRIECYGFVFEEIRNPRKVDADRVRSYGVPAEDFAALQQGKDWVNPKGTIVPNDELTVPATRTKKYVYCADTLYNEDMVENILDADLLYHETTYLKDQETHALQRFHSTTHQAARIASLARARKLIIGHFSSKYEDLQPFLEEASAIFPHTELAVEGSCFKL